MQATTVEIDSGHLSQITYPQEVTQLSLDAIHAVHPAVQAHADGPDSSTAYTALRSRGSGRQGGCPRAGQRWSRSAIKQHDQALGQYRHGVGAQFGPGEQLSAADAEPDNLRTPLQLIDTPVQRAESAICFDAQGSISEMSSPCVTYRSREPRYSGPGRDDLPPPGAKKALATKAHWLPYGFRMMNMAAKI